LVLHMSPLPTVAGSDFSSVDLPGDGIKACKAARLDVSNDRQHVGRKLRRLCLGGHAHALDGAGRIERASFFPRGLAAARAEIASRSCSATAPKMWVVRVAK
jgi:hypothetical protein